MGIRTDPADPTLHHIDCRPDGYKGKRVREDFRGSREEAEEYYRVLMRRPMSRNLPRPMTLKAMWPEYLEWCRANHSPTTTTSIQTAWRAHLSPFFGGLQIKMLTRALIERYKQRRLAEHNRRRGDATVKPRTITKEIRYLSGMIKWATRMEYCDPLSFSLEGFPAKLTRAPKAHPLTAGQVNALLAELPDAYLLPVLLMVDAGLRAGEAMSIKAEHVDMERGVLYVTGKGNKERIIPVVTARLRARLESALSSGRGEYLSLNPRTGKPFQTIKRGLASAAVRAGIKQHVHPHLLRHTFGTLATVSGVAQAALQGLMGHSTPVVTAIYQTLAVDQLRAQASKFGDMIDAAGTSSCPHGRMDNPDNTMK